MRIKGIGIALLGLSLHWGAQAETTDRKLGEFRNTFYCLTLEQDFAKGPMDTLLDMRGQVLARVYAGFKKDLFIEGSGKLLDGRVVNYAGTVKKESRYRFSPNAFGDGVGTCALVPFHTIAVDPKRIPLGSLVRIKETVGMKLPDGSVHNGLWRADDVGSAIKGDRIDLFVGAGQASGRVLAENGISHLQALTVELVQAPGADNCATSLLLEDATPQE